MVPTADHSAAMFFVVVSCVWFGTSNAAREIVTERAVYLRERMVNLRLVNYVLSKFIILAGVCVIQCVCLLGIVFFTLGFNGGPVAFLLELVAMVAVAINACALGLLLSTVVVSAEAAMALTPIALIPQVVLGGLMVPMTTNPMLRPLMYVDAGALGLRGVDRAGAGRGPERSGVADRPEVDPEQPRRLRRQRALPVRDRPDGERHDHGRVGVHEWSTFGVAIGVLFGMTAFMLIAAARAAEAARPGVRP